MLREKQKQPQNQKPPDKGKGKKQNQIYLDTTSRLIEAAEIRLPTSLTPTGPNSILDSARLLSLDLRLLLFRVC